MKDVTLTGDAVHAPDLVKQFAQRMADIQKCRVVVTQEASGFHLYLPCPDCLHTHGERELNEPKYAINLTKYLDLDSLTSALMPGRKLRMSELLAQDALRTERDGRSGVCMRTRQSRKPHFFSVTELMQMQSVTERHPDIHTKAMVVGQADSAERESFWVPDPVSGVLCPPPPGMVTPVTELPDNHPAVVYLKGRGYDLEKLYQQFKCSFCTEEYPESKPRKIFYRKMQDGWKDTPQHRIIFYSMIRGAPLTWQARLIEMVEGNERWMLHPYKMNRGPSNMSPHAPFVYSLTHTRPNAASAWIPASPYDEKDAEGALKFQPSKYRTAKHSSREMMGWDAAVERADKDDNPQKWCVLVEGPLDAARVGPGGIALIGSSINPANADLVASTFHIVLTAFDADVVGRAATERIGKAILTRGGRNCVTQVCSPIPVTGGKDIGDMPQATFDALLNKSLKRAIRGY